MLKSLLAYQEMRELDRCSWRKNARFFRPKLSSGQLAFNETSLNDELFNPASKSRFLRESRLVFEFSVRRLRHGTID